VSAAHKISAIVPTIGRPDSLRRLLESLAAQTRRPDEIIVADGSGGHAIAELTDYVRWREAGLAITRISVSPPHAVRQREAAIAKASGDMLLLLDDDVSLEQDCVSQMVHVFDSRRDAVGVMADINNQSWSMPTRAWRLFLRRWLGLEENAWQGRVVGPLLRFGFSPVPEDVVVIDWLSTCNSMVRRTAYDAVGGFSDFFLHRCTMNEDIDLGLKLRRVGILYFAPKARLAHFQAPGGRVTRAVAAEDDIFNRYMILRRTLGKSRVFALRQIILFVVIETASNFLGGIVRGRLAPALDLARGRFGGLWRVAAER
jgi:glycosyltransferase involved in cell wall biosynthesis